MKIRKMFLLVPAIAVISAGLLFSVSKASKPALASDNVSATQTVMTVSDVNTLTGYRVMCGSPCSGYIARCSSVPTFYACWQTNYPTCDCGTGKK